MPRTRNAFGVIAACLLAAPAPALAGPPKAPVPELAPIAQGEKCPVPELSTPLASFGDTRSYVLAPGGSFEQGSEAWALTGGAKVESGNSPWYVTGADHSRSLTLPEGATATSPAFCVDEDWPSFRLFSQGGKGKEKLKVEVLAAEPIAGDKRPLGGSLEASEWALSDDLRLFSDGPAAGVSRKVVVKITAPGRGGTWSVDDVLVDPRCR